MKRTLYLLGIFICSMLQISCGSEEENFDNDTIAPVTFEELISFCDNHLYLRDYKFTNLKKKHGQWKETKIDEKALTRADEYNLDFNPDRDLWLLFPFPNTFPEYFWFKDSKVYSDYSEMIGEISAPYDFHLSKLSDSDTWNAYCESVTSPESKFDYKIWFSKLNTLQIDKENRLNMSFNEHPLRLMYGHYNYVIEKVDSSSIVIRLEFEKSKYGCDGVRFTYKLSPQLPKYYVDFEATEEAGQFINAVLSGQDPMH